VYGDWRLPAVGQELVDASRGMCVDAEEHVLEVSDGVESLASQVATRE
jgi:hypothetical protein